MPITFCAKVLCEVFFWNHILNLGLGWTGCWAGWAGAGLVLDKVGLPPHRSLPAHPGSVGGCPGVPAAFL